MPKVQPLGGLLPFPVSPLSSSSSLLLFPSLLLCRPRLSSRLPVSHLLSAPLHPLSYSSHFSPLQKKFGGILQHRFRFLAPGYAAHANTAIATALGTREAGA